MTTPAMRFEHHLSWLTNSKRKAYEDRFLLPLGALPERLEAAATEHEERSVQAKIDAITARGLVFAVLDGVGGAPLGMAAAQHAVDTLRQLYRRPELAPRDGFPTARDVLALLYESNEQVFAWGPIEDDDAVVAGRSVRKYIGLGATLHIDTFAVTGLEAGDLIALVTDGVYPKGYGSRDRIRDVLDAADGDPETAADWLVERSRARGSVDDITALVLCVT